MGRPPPPPHPAQPPLSGMRLAFALALALHGTSIPSPGASTAPNAKSPETSLPSLQTSRSRLQEALRSGNPASVRDAVEVLRLELGDRAGVPEFPTLHHPPPDSSPFPPDRAWQYLDRELGRLESRLPWRLNPKGDPERMDEGLRTVAIPVRLLALIARHDPASRAFALPLAREGADHLLTLQHESGLFPFPIGPARGNARSASGPAAARLLREHPDWFENGWAIEDGDDGGLQYDTGLCGIALLEAHVTTGHAPYLAAARRAGHWLRQRPLVPNWNYNAFGVSLLARLHKITGDPQILEALDHRVRVGILPGQLPNGPWVDPHNARLVYHNVLLRSLIDTDESLPPGHPLRPALTDALQRAVRMASRITLKEGYAGTFVDSLARMAARADADPETSRALNVALNAALGRRRGAPAPGDAIVDYLVTCPPRRP